MPSKFVPVREFVDAVDAYDTGALYVTQGGYGATLAEDGTLWQRAVLLDLINIVANPLNTHYERMAILVEE